MPAFTSVAFRQQRSGGAVAPQPHQPPVGGAAAAEQVGGGMLGDVGTGLAKAASKTQKVATGLASAASSTKAGYRRLGDVLDDTESLLPQAAEAASKTSKASRAGRKGAATTAKSPGGKVGKGAKGGKNGGQKGRKGKEALDKVAKLGIRAGDKLKNKNLGEIVEGSSSTSKALQGVGKELGKRGGKAAVAAAATAAFTAGAAAGVKYLEHVASGGEPMSAKEIGMLAADTGLGLARQGLEGKLTRASAGREIMRSYNDIIKSKQGGRPLPKTINLKSILGNLGKLLEKLRKIHRRRHYQVHGDAPLALEPRRPFGSGMTMFGGGRRRGRKSAGRSGCRRKRKGGRKKKKCSHGSRRLHNIFTGY